MQARLRRFPCILCAYLHPSGRETNPYTIELSGTEIAKAASASGSTDRDRKGRLVRRQQACKMPAEQVLNDLGRFTSPDNRRLAAAPMSAAQGEFRI
jgi:hypothetical protein